MNQSVANTIAFEHAANVPVVYFERHGTLPFGQLNHGKAGIRQDFASLFGIDRMDMVRDRLGRNWFHMMQQTL